MQQHNVQPQVLEVVDFMETLGWFLNILDIFLVRKFKSLSILNLFFYGFFFLENKYNIGKTYGNTSRELPVCAHSYSNYGDFVRSKTTMSIRETNNA